MVWSPTGSNDTHIDAVLTNISVGWSNEGLVGERLFPKVVVRKQADKYYTFGRESWVPSEGDYRAPGTEANEVPGLGLAFDTYYAQEHALQIPVTDEERENVDSPLSPDRDGTELITDKILLAREKAMKDLVTDASAYASGMTSDVSSKKWNGSTGEPVQEIKKGKRAMHARVFMEPNTTVIPYKVMSALEDNADIIDRIKYSERAILTPDIIASVLGVQNVIVPGLGVVANEATMIPSYLWGSDVILAYVPSRPGLRVPAFGYEFVWGYGGGTPMAVDRWREDKRKTDMIRVQRRYDLKLVGKENNVLDVTDHDKVITGFLIQNTI